MKKKIGRITKTETQHMRRAIIKRKKTNTERKKVVINCRRKESLHEVDKHAIMKVN